VIAPRTQQPRAVCRSIVSSSVRLAANVTWAVHRDHITYVVAIDGGSRIEVAQAELVGPHQMPNENH
jgi:hypothetical protein